jgi:3',5'-cyclic AMP phosphodiesterase CpdA
LRILHYSDVHVDVPISEVPLRDWLGKRLIGGINHTLRRRALFVNSRKKLAALARFATEERIDLAIGTGDFTILGTHAELAAASAAVAPMGDLPLGMITIPGNHDLYLHDSAREERFTKYFGKWTTTDRPDLASTDGWPLVRLVTERVAVVSVASARPNPEPWRSAGRIPDVQLRALGRILQDSEVMSRFVIVITHYAPRLWNGKPDAPLHGLENADDFLRVVAPLKHGVVLHGHVHRRYRLDLPGVSPPFLGAGSTTQEGREGLWMIQVADGHATAVPGHWNGRGYELDGDRADAL